MLRNYYYYHLRLAGSQPRFLETQDWMNSGHKSEAHHGILIRIGWMIGWYNVANIEFEFAIFWLVQPRPHKLRAISNHSFINNQTSVCLGCCFVVSQSFGDLSLGRWGDEPSSGRYFAWFVHRTAAASQGEGTRAATPTHWPSQASHFCDARPWATWAAWGLPEWRTSVRLACQSKMSRLPRQIRTEGACLCVAGLGWQGCVLPWDVSRGACWKTRSTIWDSRTCEVSAHGFGPPQAAWKPFCSWGWLDGLASKWWSRWCGRF